MHTSSGYSFLIYNNMGQLMFQKFGSNEGDLSSKWTYVQVPVFYWLQNIFGLDLWIHSQDLIMFYFIYFVDRL